MLIRKRHVRDSRVLNNVRIFIKYTSCLLAILAQIGLYIYLLYWADNLWYLQIPLTVLSVILLLYIQYTNDNINYRMSWTFFILLAPAAGTLLYLVFGGKRSVPRKKQREVRQYLSDNALKTDDTERLSPTLDPLTHKLTRTLHKNSGMPVFYHTATRYYKNIVGKHRDLLEDLKNAREFIFIEYFIASDGYVLNTILDILEQKGSEGVEIKFIFDEIGSARHLKPSTRLRIASVPNLKLCIYEPLGLRINPRINYRDHRKIVVVDGRIGYIGGDNLADEYVNRKVKFGHWRDNAMRLCGDAVDGLSLLFCEMWCITAGEQLDFDRYRRGYVEEGNGMIQPFGDGPADEADAAYELFTGLVMSADRYLYLSTPYFIIDEAFLTQVEIAIKRGVDVKLLVPKIPDKRFTYRLTRGHYRKILRAGGQVFEYTPGFNHAKNVIVDDRYAFIGTVNCDYRSMFLHFENGALLIDNSDILEMRDDFLNAVACSEEITLEKWKKRPILNKLIEAVFQIVSPLF